METVFWEYALPCICAFWACVGFTLMFNIHGLGKLIAGVGGALGWLVYLLGGQTIFAAFLAATVIGVFAEVMSRVRRCPVTGYVLVALLPLLIFAIVFMLAMLHLVDHVIANAQSPVYPRRVRQRMKGRKNK